MGFSKTGTSPSRWIRPKIPWREAQVVGWESSKRQQCVRATELAKRMGRRYAGLSDPTDGSSERDSRKAFDENGRIIFMVIPGNQDSCRWTDIQTFNFQRQYKMDKKGAGDQE